MNRYTINYTSGVFTGFTAGTATFPLSERCQGKLGSETSIGVRVVWNYTAPNGIPIKNYPQQSDYAVERAALKAPEQG
jgi:hypothetical protein